MPWTTPETFTAGQTLTAASMNLINGNVSALYAPVQRLGYQERTTDYTTTTNLYASASDVFTTGITFTADGTSRYRVVFWASTVDTTASGRDLYLSLNIDGTETGRTNNFDVSSRSGYTLYIERWHVFTSGSRTINFRGVHGGGAVSMRAGNGTGTNAPPMWMAVYGPPLA